MQATTVATAVRIPAKSGNRDNDYWQAKCGDCGWVDPALYSNRTIEGRELAQRNAAEHTCPVAALRYSVNAMHAPSNGFDGPTTVDYWRVLDSVTEMRANGTAKYQDRAQAQEWCDHLNRTAH